MSLTTLNITVCCFIQAVTFSVFENMIHFFWVKHYILKAEQGFLDAVYTEVWIAKFAHYHHSHRNKERFLREKRKGKRFLYFYDYGKKAPCERGCSWIIVF